MQRVSFTLEFIFKASPTIVYKFLTSPDCLIRWFCDKVDITEDVYTFEWDGEEEEAELIDDFEEELLRFRWEDAEEGETIIRGEYAFSSGRAHDVQFSAEYAFYFRYRTNQLVCLLQ